MTLSAPLAWPLATLLIAVIFRHDLGRAMGRLGQLKYRDLEVTFRDDLHQAEELARSIPSPAPRAAIMLEVDVDEAKPLVGRLIGGTSTPPTMTPESRESLLDLAARAPREAVETAWGLVGRALVRSAKASGDRRASAGLANSDVAARYLVDRGRLTGVEGVLIRLLRTLRDRSARLDQPPPSPDEARRFVELATKMASRIDDHG